MNQKPTFGRPHLFYLPFVTSSSLLAAHRLFFVRCSPFATSCPSLLAFRHFFVPPPPPRLHSSSVLLPSFRPTPSPPFSLPVGAQLCLVASSILSQRFSKRIGRVNRVTLHCFSSLQLFFARRHAFVLLVAHVSSPSSCSSCVNSSPSALLAVRRLLVLLVAPHRRLVLLVVRLLCHRHSAPLLPCTSFSASLCASLCLSVLSVPRSSLCLSALSCLSMCLCALCLCGSTLSAFLGALFALSFSLRGFGEDEEGRRCREAERG